MYVGKAQKQFNTNTLEEYGMTRPFTTNWHIYKCCLSTESSESEYEQSDCERSVLLLNQIDAAEENAALKKSNGFNRLLIEAVDEALSSLGYSAKKTIYYYLEKRYSITLADIPDKTAEFTTAIEKLLGPGAKIIQIRIMEELFQKVKKCKKVKSFEYSSAKKGITFTEYIATLHKHYCNGAEDKLTH